jgi:hypothetical protein
VDRATQIENLAQKMRLAAVPLSTAEFELIKRDISDIQHSADELMSAAKAGKHEDAHHSSETLERQLETLEKDLTRIKTEMRM